MAKVKALPPLSVKRLVNFGMMEQWNDVEIVVDRFHVMKHLNERITQLCRKMRNNASDDIKEILKG